MAARRCIGPASALLGIATAIAAPASAEAVKSVDAPLCKQISMRVAENTKANFVRFNTTRTVAFFAHPLAYDITVTCFSRLYLKVAVSTTSPYPDDLWFYLAAEAGRAVSDVAAAEMEEGARKCHKMALLEDGNIGYADVPNVHIECYVYTDPPSSSVHFFLRDAENNKVLGQPE